ncbi:MAG: HPr(Ser) kinase/phosphatase, partial [Lachnospiraceae bacterium]|nr:HPr(Ser) kinase/phosphatase [Lachnospiraceae bacterium]
MASVSLEAIIEKMSLTNLTPEIDISEIKIEKPDINRPALQFADYFELFDAERIEIIGAGEYSFLEQKDSETRRQIYEKFMNNPIPCIVFCRSLEPDPDFKELAVKYKVPLLKSAMPNSAFMAEIIRWLNVRLAPCISIHGVLVDVYGEGVLITGESGIGKSEAALELIKRG